MTHAAPLSLALFALMLSWRIQTVLVGNRPSGRAPPPLWDISCWTTAAMPERISRCIRAMLLRTKNWSPTPRTSSSSRMSGDSSVASEKASRAYIPEE